MLYAFALALTLTAQTESPGEPGGKSTIKIVSRKSSPESAALQSASAPALLVPVLAPQPAPSRPPAIAAAPRVDFTVAGGHASAPAVDLVGHPPASDGPRIVPWVALGGSALAGILGAVFASKTLTAVDELGELKAEVHGNSLTLPDEFKDQQKAVFTNGLASTLLLSTAIAGAIASTLVLTAD